MENGSTTSVQEQEEEAIETVLDEPKERLRKQLVKPSHCGGPRLWLSPQCGHGGAAAGRRGRADPSSDLPPGNRGGPAFQCAGLAAATR